MAALLWPYEELTLSRGRSPGEFVVSTPWCARAIQASPTGRALADRILAEGANVEDLLDCYSGLLQPLIHEPFCYILPRTAEASAGDEPRFRSGAIDRLAADRWTWDADAALAMSQLEGQGRHDPLTLLSVFRRYALLDGVEADANGALCARLESLAERPAALGRAAALVTAQNLHVTRRCEAALLAALPRAQRAAPALRAFIAAEKGHDRLLARALRSIVEARNVPAPWTRPLAHTVSLMDVFEAAGRANFLAFAFGVSLFEQADDSEEDRVAKAFAAGGLTEAAALLERHRAINVEGAHDRVVFELLRFMAPVTPEYARQAARWAERLSGLINGYAGSVEDALGAKAKPRPTRTAKRPSPGRTSSSSGRSAS